MTRFIVARHGNTFAADEPARRIGARTDLPLVASGRRQADVLGRWLALQPHPIARIISGPLRRTRETAERIAVHLGHSVTIETVDWLQEIDHGPDEGCLETEVLERIGQAALDTWNSRALPPAGWFVDAERRLASWRELFDRPASRDALLVTSNGSARYAALACAAETWPTSFKLATGALGEIQVSAPGRAEVVQWNFVPSEGRIDPRPRS